MGEENRTQKRIRRVHCSSAQCSDATAQTSWRCARSRWNALIYEERPQKRGKAVARTSGWENGRCERRGGLNEEIAYAGDVPSAPHGKVAPAQTRPSATSKHSNRQCDR